MENSQGTSFIPKSPVKGTVKPRGVRRVYILTYVTYVLFFGTLLATAGVFMYGLTIDAQLVSEKERLSVERDSFNQADLEKVRELESRMDTAFSILDRHVSLHSVFKALEVVTLRPVQLYGFEYTKDLNNSLNLTLLARTKNFNNALFQREILSGNAILNGATISDIKYTGSEPEDGLPAASEEVQFTITKKLSVGDIPYTGSSVTSDDSFTITDSFTDSLGESETFTEEDTFSTSGEDSEPWVDTGVTDIINE